MKTSTGIYLPLLLTFCWSCDGSTPTRLAEKPAEKAAAYTPATQPSHVAVTVDLPLAELRTAAQQATPENFSKSGTEKKCEKTFLGKVCGDVKYKFTVKRSGPVHLVPSPAGPGTLRASVPLSFSGHAGLKGDLAKLLDLDKKNFNGAIEARADLALEVDATWCPQVKVSTSFDWHRKARIEIIGGVWIEVAELVQGDLESALQQIAKDIASAIDCGHLRGQLEAVWQPQALAISLPQNNQAYVNLEPLGMGFSGLTVDAAGIRFAAALDVRAEIGTSPLTATATALPPLTRVPLSPGRLELHVPFRAPYAELASVLTAHLTRAALHRRDPGGRRARED